MSKQVIQAVRSRAYWLAGLQFIVIAIASLVALLFLNKKVAYSLFLGGLVSILPNIYFAKRLFQRTYARAAVKIVRTFYVNEVIKLLLIGLLFVTMMRLQIAAEFPLILGFIIAQVCVFFLPLVYSIDKIISQKKAGHKEG